jgi:hypothetical protein
MTTAEARSAARLVARRIVRGEVEAYAGATTIWKQILDALEGPIPDDLWPFKSAASAIEDCLWDAQDSGADHDLPIARCREEIVQAARRLAGADLDRDAP